MQREEGEDLEGKAGEGTGGKEKCLPSLYGLDACPINKSQIKSLDFILNGVFRKIF